MNIKDQMTLENEMSQTIDRLENRAVQVGKRGLKYFTGIISDILGDMKTARKAKDKEVYGELMQIESLVRECEPSKQSAQILTKIGKIKGLIGIFIICLNLHPLFFGGVRPRSRDTQVQIVRNLRRKDEIYG